MIMTMYFFIQPRPDTFIVAFLSTLLSLIFYLMRGETNEYYNVSIIDHTILILPFFIYKYYFNINLEEFKITKYFMAFMVFIIFYYFYGKSIYV